MPQGWNIAFFEKHTHSISNLIPFHTWKTSKISILQKIESSLTAWKILKKTPEVELKRLCILFFELPVCTICFNYTRFKVAFITTRLPVAIFSDTQWASDLQTDKKTILVTKSLCLTLFKQRNTTVKAEILHHLILQT